MSSIKAIIFDLGGVLFSDGTSFIETKGLSVGTVYKNILRSKKAALLRKGIISYSDFKEWLSTVLPSDTSPEEFMQEWFNSYVLDKNLFELIKKLRKRYYLVAFSGNIKERIDFLDNKYLFRSLFDLEVYSYSYNLNKDDLGFYKKLLEKIPCMPDECLFLDDNSEFLKNAQNLGIHTHKYVGYKEFEKLVNDDKLLENSSYLSIAEGESPILIFSDKSDINKYDCDKYYWVPIDKLFFRGYRLRPSREIAVTLNGEFQNITPSCKDIAEFHKDPKFNSPPIWVSLEDNRLLVYEGRHRIVGAKMAGRKYILAQFISQQHPKVLDQKNHLNTRYYNKDIVSMQEFYNYHITSFVLERHL